MSEEKSLFYDEKYSKGYNNGYRDCFNEAKDVALKAIGKATKIEKLGYIFFISCS